MHQLQLVSPSPSCSIAFLVPRQVVVFLFTFLYFLLLMFRRTAKIINQQVLYLSIITRFGLLFGIIIIIINRNFSYQRMLMVFHWRLSNNKFPQVSRNLLSILANFNNPLVLGVFTGPLIFMSSNPFTNSLVTVPKILITISITVTFMFHSFFQFPSGVQVFILLFAFFQFYLVVSWDSKVQNLASSLCFLL